METNCQESFDEEEFVEGRPGDIAREKNRERKKRGGGHKKLHRKKVRHQLTRRSLRGSS